MNHILVLPYEFQASINTAYQNEAVRETWIQIGINTAQEMIETIIAKFNLFFPKLNIKSHRFEHKDIIKMKVGNQGNASVYTGYIEGNSNVVGLFFYIQPSLDSANDILTRHMMPTLLGIYDGIKDHMVDLHFNNRPVYIANLNENGRSEQTSVKKNFICAELLGFNYVDIFNRDYKDIIRDIDFNGSPLEEIRTLEQFNILMEFRGVNPYFMVDESEVKLLSEKVVNSSNSSAEIYRYFLKVLPAIYFGIETGLSINFSDFDDVELRHIDTIRAYINNI